MREFEAIIKVPKGTTISYGKVAPQTIDKTGSILKGGADQILLPRDWPEEWVQQIVKLSSKQTLYEKRIYNKKNQMRNTKI